MVNTKPIATISTRKDLTNIDPHLKILAGVRYSIVAQKDDTYHIRNNSGNYVWLEKAIFDPATYSKIQTKKMPKVIRSKKIGGLIAG